MEIHTRTRAGNVGDGGDEWSVRFCGLVSAWYDGLMVGEGGKSGRAEGSQGGRGG